MTAQRVGVVGGGIVGLAVGRELARRHGAEVTVLEKEQALAAHQTGHNSGVVHAGIYYRPGSLKATLCTRGRDLLRDFCAEHGIAYDECGKLVVALDPSETRRFDDLEKTARENGVPGLRRLDGAEIADVEPHATGLAALHSPRTAITDYPAVARALGAQVEAAGGQVLLGREVTGIRQGSGGVVVRSAGPGEEDGPVQRVFDRVVVCAGLQSDRVGVTERGPVIVPFRGEYMRVAAAKQDLVRGMVYPVPDPRYPFLGVHFTRRVDGTLEVGPNAVLALAREGYGRWGLDLGDVADVVRWPGFWRVAATHWRTGARELAGSLSVRAYMRTASRYVPAIGAGDVVRAGSGVRAQAVDRDGSLVDDFRIVTSGDVTCVRNAPSPAATSSLAIAEHVADLLG